MSVKTVRRVAAHLLKSGESRIRILDAKRASEALTREDIRGMIKEKLVIALPKSGVSRGKARRTQKRKRAGRGRGEGSRQGAKYAGVTRKSLWMRKIRALRKTLRNNKYRLSGGDYRKIYKMISGNAFREKRILLDYISKRAAANAAKVE